MLKINEKYYVADRGLREAIIASNLQNIELILENIVFLELINRGYKVCCLLSDETTVQREFASLLEMRDNYPKLVSHAQK